MGRSGPEAGVARGGSAVQAAGHKRAQSPHFIPVPVMPQAVGLVRKVSHGTYSKNKSKVAKSETILY